MTLRRWALIALLLMVLGVAGCSISRNIVDLTPPANQSPLQELERHLTYHDPDAGRPDYVRVR